MARKSKAELAAVAAVAANTVVNVGLAKIKPGAAKEYFTEVWGGVKEELPDLFQMITGDGEVVLSGQHLEESKNVLKAMEEDIFLLKKGEISKAEFVELVRRRKAALFALYGAEKISRSRPSEQKILDAIVRVAETLVVKAIPIILGLV